MCSKFFPLESLPLAVFLFLSSNFPCTIVICIIPVYSGYIVQVIILILLSSLPYVRIFPPESLPLVVSWLSSKFPCSIVISIVPVTSGYILQVIIRILLWSVLISGKDVLIL